VSKLGEREKYSCGKVVRHEPHEDRGWYLSPFHDSEFHKPRDNTSSVSQGHARQFAESGQSQLFGGASERPQDSPLRVGDQRFDRSAKVHRVTIPLMDERVLSFVRWSWNGAAGPCAS